MLLLFSAPDFCSYYQATKDSYCARAKRKLHYPIPMVIVALVLCFCNFDIPKSHNLHTAFSILVEDKRTFPGLILRIQSKQNQKQM
jgi:hypothetical protein